MKNTLTQARLKEYLLYTPEYGVFIWRRQKRRANVGTIAGTVNPNGYCLIGIDGVQYRAHRLAFLYMQGSFPANYVDHIDGDTLNNRWTNLRNASKQQNGFNVGLKITNTTGSKGVSYRRDRGKFRAYLRVDGIIKHLGYYSSVQEATEVVTNARQKYHQEFAKHC